MTQTRQPDLDTPEVPTTPEVPSGAVGKLPYDSPRIVSSKIFHKVVLAGPTPTLPIPECQGNGGY